MKIDLDNQFDLNECFMYCDQKAREYCQLDPKQPVNLSYWRDVFLGILEMIGTTKKTMDLCEAVMDPNDLEKMWTDGLPGTMLGYPAVDNESFRFQVTSHSFTVEFVTDDGLGDELLLLDGLNENGLVYEANQQMTFPGWDDWLNEHRQLGKQANYHFQISGPLTTILEEGFKPLLETIFVPNIDHFFRQIRQFYVDNELDFRYPLWYLRYHLQELIKIVQEDFQLDSRIISSGAIRQATAQRGPFVEENIRQARERLGKELPRTAQFYDYQIRLYCLDN